MLRASMEASPQYHGAILRRFFILNLIVTVPELANTATSAFFTRRLVQFTLKAVRR
jgi:hypothetical protein